MKRYNLIFALITLGISFASHADEKFAERGYWIENGYQSQAGSRSSKMLANQPVWQSHSLPWPVSFQDPEHSMGNSMLEFQNYGDGPYYHGGCDLRVKKRAPVYAPVGGRIEAGHYGYTNHPDGSAEKFWMPWPQSGEKYYFEVAVITDDGYRFELHHMDETQMSAEVLAILKSGQPGRVAAGALLGNTVAWPDGVYHHTHYNIISPSGIELNPEFYSPLIPDTIAPQVTKVLASFASGQVAEFGDGRFTQRPEFFAVAVIDRKDKNIYDHPPVFAGIEFEDGNSFAWDFRERLFGSDGKYPPIWNFYVDSIKGPNGQNFSTAGGYGKGLSVVRVYVPANARGKFNLKVSDQAGNVTSFSGSID